jgi:hypothetical protein
VVYSVPVTAAVVTGIVVFSSGMWFRYMKHVLNSHVVRKYIVSPECGDGRKRRMHFQAV